MSSLFYRSVHSIRAFWSCLFASVPLRFALHNFFVLCEFRCRRNTLVRFSVSGIESKHVILYQVSSLC